MMSDTQQGPDWWMASDGKWYPPQSAPAPATPPPPGFPPPVQPVYVTPVQSGPINDGFCITGLVCGIVGIVTAWACGIGLVLGILGLVFGILGVRRVDQSMGLRKGRGMGLAGAICGGIAIVLFILWIVLIIVANDSNTTYYNS